MAFEFPIDLGFIAEIQLRQTYQGSRILNVLHYEFIRLSAGAVPTDGYPEVLELMTKVGVDVGGVGEVMRQMQVDTLIHNGVRGQIVFPNRYPYIPNPLGVPGAVNEDGLPSNVAAVIEKRASLTGRGRQGSVHIAGIPKSYTDGAELTAPAIADLNAVANAVDDNVVSATPEFGWRPLCSVPKELLAAKNYVIAAFGQTTARVVRRRTLGVGE